MRNPESMERWAGRLEKLGLGTLTVTLGTIGTEVLTDVVPDDVLAPLVFDGALIALTSLVAARELRRWARQE